MRHVSTIAALLFCTIVPIQGQENVRDKDKVQAFTETWKGTLLDAGCKEVRDETERDSTRGRSDVKEKTKDPDKTLVPAKRSFDRCEITASTTAFVLMSGGKLLKFDETSNAGLRNQMKSKQSESDRNTAILVSVTGSMDKSVIHLSTVSFTEQPQ